MPLCPISPDLWTPYGRGPTKDGQLLVFAEHAVAVYGSPDEYRAFADSAGFEASVMLSEGPAQAGIAFHGDTAVISVRGSSERRDWRDDFMSIIKRRWPGFLPKRAKVGWGFLRQARKLLPAIAAELDEWFSDAQDPRVVIVGHSLGAPVASLLSVGLRHLAPRFEPAALYLFASPRVGNRAWADYYRSTADHPTYSLVNVRRGVVDLVTRVPKRRWGFRHIGSRIVLDDCRLWTDLGAWRRYRDKSGRVGHLAAWRIISRTVAGARAHGGQALLASLRRLVYDR